MNFEDYDDEASASRRNLASLLSRFSKQYAAGDKRTESFAETRSDTLEANRVSLSRHLSKLRVGRVTALTSDISIVHYTCSSASVVAVLDMLSDIFK